MVSPGNRFIKTISSRFLKYNILCCRLNKWTWIVIRIVCKACMRARPWLPSSVGFLCVTYSDHIWWRQHLSLSCHYGTSPSLSLCLTTEDFQFMPLWPWPEYTSWSVSSIRYLKKSSQISETEKHMILFYTPNIYQTALSLLNLCFFFLPSVFSYVNFFKCCNKV